MVANSLLWCQSDCPPQEDLGDSSHCSELYPSPSCCKDCCEQSEGGTDLPPGATAAQTWHKGGGAESALHAAWMYASDLDENHWIVKLNFKNTFNSAQG